MYPLKREEAKEHASLGCYEKVLILISCFYDYSITGACEGCLVFELTIFKEFVNKRRRRCADGNAGGETFPQKFLKCMSHFVRVMKLYI